MNKLSIKEAFYEHSYQKDMMNMSDKYNMFIKEMKKYHGKFDRFLDYGCGDGSFMEAVKKEVGGKEVYGCDISKEAVNIINEKRIGNGYVVDVDKQRLPFDNDFFDLIFCGEIIEHLYDPERLLEELFRVCGKGGHIFLTTPNLGAWFNRLSLLLGYMPVFCDTGLKHNCGYLWKMNPVGHLRLYTYDALKKMLCQYNFRMIKSVGIGINKRIGFGQKHKFFSSAANSIFSHPSLASGILAIITPNK